MKPITNKTAIKILDTVTADLEIGDARKYDDSPGIFQPLCVDRIGENQWALAHYFEMNGDLVPDPDMVFHKTENGDWFPVHFQNQFIFHYCLDFDAEGKINKVKPNLLRDLISFSTMWMKNIKEQQNID